MCGEGEGGSCVGGYMFVRVWVCVCMRERVFVCVCMCLYVDGG